LPEDQNRYLNRYLNQSGMSLMYSADR
jgi:hypothetical protein